jgi:hypothetical protein
LVKFEASTDIMNRNLWKISSLIHRDSSSLFAQPDVNHRPLSMSFLNNRDFLSKMQGKNNDFGEEMHALVYEEVKVYSTYTTDEESTMWHEIPKTYAIYPTKEGLQKFADALQLTQKDESNNKVEYVAHNNSPSEIHRLLLSWAINDRDIYYSWRNENGEKIKRKKQHCPNTKYISKNDKNDYFSTTNPFSNDRRSTQVWLGYSFIDKCLYLQCKTRTSKR